MRVHPGHKGIDPPHLRLRRGSLRGIGARWLPEFCRSLPIGIRNRTLDKLSLSATALRAGRNAGRHVGTALRADDIDLRNQFPTFVAFDAGKTCHGKTPESWGYGCSAHRPLFHSRRADKSEGVRGPSARPKTAPSPHRRDCDPTCGEWPNRNRVEEAY